MGGREACSREARRDTEPRKEQGSAWHLISIQWLLVKGRQTLEKRRAEKPGGESGTKTESETGTQKEEGEGAGDDGTAHEATERPLRREGK